MNSNFANVNQATEFHYGLRYQARESASPQGVKEHRHASHLVITLRAPNGKLGQRLVIDAQFGSRVALLGERTVVTSVIAAGQRPAVQYRQVHRRQQRFLGSCDW